MQLDEMNMTDLAAMFAMMGLLARGSHGTPVAAMAYDYAEFFIEQKKRREQENEDEQL